MQLFIILLSLPSLIILIDFIWYLVKGKRLLGNVPIRILEVVSVVILPALYLAVLDIDFSNDCCNDSATFSPPHRLSVYLLIVLCIVVYFYSSYRRKLAPPIVEVAVNIILLIAIILNIFISFHLHESWLALLGNLPVILLYIHALIKNHLLFIFYAQTIEINSERILERFAWKILSLKPISKIPVLFILCLPLLVIVSGFLLLFGQKPDSLIRAFTDTYKHGFSQLDYLCDNVECGGHFLCSVAAKGHTKVVKPHRLGIRNNALIMCNRQLLISNAFEELIQQKMPATHKRIRYFYNKVGNLIHRYYSIFNNKYVADIIYIFMKPLEWFFIVILYTCDTNPENRIAQQYLSSGDRRKLTQF